MDIEPTDRVDEPPVERADEEPPLERPAAQPRARGAGGWPGYLAAAVAAVVLTLAVVLAGGGRLPGGPAPTASPSPVPSPTPVPSATPLVMPVDGAAVGFASAPLTIEIWADYQCPYCGVLSHAIEPALVREYAATGKARLVYRDFAFLGQESVDASIAARCAGNQDQYWRYHDLLFASQQGENQGAFARSNLVSLATFAGLDANSFRTCLEDATVAAAVQAETAQGRAYGIGSTPTIRVSTATHSELVRGVANFATIAATIERVTKGLPAPTATPRVTPMPSGSPGASVAPSSAASPSAAP